MHLCNLTVQSPTATPDAIFGNFSGSRTKEIIVSHGTRLELLRLDTQTRKMQSIVATDVFRSIRSLTTFKLTDGKKDYAILGSKSGRIVVLDYDAKTSSFLKLHQEIYSNADAYRTVSGQYPAPDPKGRALMIGAMESRNSYTS